MLPGVYGFTWDTGNLIFLGLFFTVAIVIVSSVLIASRRMVNDFKGSRLEKIRWETDFEDLPAAARKCRHEITGDVKHRLCDNEFDCCSCITHPKLVEQRMRKSATAAGALTSDQKMLGLTMPLDRLYHRGHTWVRPESDGTVTVGLDDLGARLIGTPDAIELPAVGTKLQVNGTAWRMKKSNADLRVLSPVDGEVVETGGAEKGWVLRLKPAGFGFDTRHLLGGEEIKPWVLREMERLQLALAPDGVGMSLADGGLLVDDISKGYPEADWDAVMGEMFLEP